MKVLHLSPNFPGEFRGGVERFVETLCPALEARGIRCAVAAGSDVRAGAGQGLGAVRRQRHGSIDVFRLHRAPADDHAVDLVHPSLAVPLAQTLDAFAPDLVHVHHWLNLGLGIVRLLHARAVRAVITLHDAWITCARFNRVVDDRFCELPPGPAHCAPCLAPVHPGSAAQLRAELLGRDLALRLELACAARVLVPSLAARTLIRRWFPDLAAPDVLPCGVPPLRPAAPYRPPAPAPAAVRIGCLGSVVVEKGVHLLLDACAGLAEHRPVELHVHGNLPDAAYARRLRAADRRGLLRLHGTYHPDDLPGLGAGLHLAVFPSVCSESYSLVLDEALGLGLPVVVSARGALDERIGDAGVRVEPESAAALLRTLLALCSAPARLASMAAATRSPRGIDAVAGELGAVYESVGSKPLPEPDAAALFAASLLARAGAGSGATTLADLDRLLADQRMAR